MEGTYGLLRDVLSYELSCAERYRRFVSLVMVTGTTTEGSARRILGDRIRNSDLLAEKNSHLVILMSETDQNGAKIAIDRYKEFGAENDLRFSLVTFPHDSGGAETLVKAGERRLERARGGSPGEVVSAG